MLGWQSFQRRATGLMAVAVAVGAGFKGIVAGHRLEPALIIPGAAAGLALGGRTRFSLIGPLVAIGAFNVEALGADRVFWRSTILVVVTVVAAWRIGRDNAPQVAAVGAMVAGFQIAAIQLLAPAAAGLNPVAFFAIVSGCWLAGAVVRQKTLDSADLASRAAELDGSRDAAARQAVIAERSKIARELHDVVSHTLTVMTLQAGGARMLLESDRKRALAAIVAIEQAGHEALAGLLRMEAVLDGEDHLGLEPQVGLGRLDRLVDEMRSSGLDVEVEVHAAPCLAESGVDVAAYQVVQEALTNALRHGQGTAALRIAATSDAVVIEVVNEIGAPFAHGSGMGLVGIGERVGLYGGSIEAGVQPDGRYSLRATLPVGAG